MAEDRKVPTPEKIKKGNNLEMIKQDPMAVEKFEPKEMPAAERKAERDGKADAPETRPGREVPAGGIMASGQASQKLRQRIKMIEHVLEEDLDELYLSMSPEKRRQFRVAGEETAREIGGLLGRTKAEARKIIELIKKWLSLIPGINKFFLEQEAKIKADEIMKMKDD